MSTPFSPDVRKTTKCTGLSKAFFLKLYGYISCVFYLILVCSKISKSADESRRCAAGVQSYLNSSFFLFLLLRDRQNRRKQ